MPDADIIEETGPPQEAGASYEPVASSADEAEGLALPPAPDVTDLDEGLILQQSEQWTGLTEDERDCVIETEIALLSRMRRSLYDNLLIGRGLSVFQRYIMQITGADSPRRQAYRTAFNGLAPPEIKAMPSSRRAEYIWLWVNRAVVEPWWDSRDERTRRRWNTPDVIRLHYQLGDDISPEPHTMIDPHSPNKEIALASPPGAARQAERAQTILASENRRLTALVAERAADPVGDIRQAMDNVEAALPAPQWPALKAQIMEFIERMDTRYTT
jgi:hypothetical protein